MKVFRGVLVPELLESVQFYVRQRARTPYMQPEGWGRLIRHNDPIAILLHELVTPAVQEHLGVPIKRSYAFLACYLEGGRVPRHLDRAQCRYTLDLCIEDSGGDGPWPLYVEDQQVLLESNDAVLYRGTEQYHHRDAKPPGKVANLVFFHFVDQDFEGDLN